MKYIKECLLNLGCEAECRKMVHVKIFVQKEGVSGVVSGVDEKIATSFAVSDGIKRFCNLAGPCSMAKKVEVE